MEKYIGTNVIEAEPAIRKGGRLYLPSDPIPKTMEPAEEGYRVQDKDGYESWSPKAEFEEAYHKLADWMPTMNFGDAITAMKAGQRVRRRGWNGKNQYIELAAGISYINTRRELVNAEHDAIGNMAVAFVGTSGVQMGWLASQADMLAEDWEIV